MAFGLSGGLDRLLDDFGAKGLAAWRSNMGQDGTRQGWSIQRIMASASGKKRSAFSP